MKSLRQDGWRKVLVGHTTVDEVARVTAGDSGVMGRRDTMFGAERSLRSSASRQHRGFTAGSVGIGAFRPTIASGFARMQADAGDTLLNHYVLEHEWQWLTRADYVGT